MILFGYLDNKMHATECPRSIVEPEIQSSSPLGGGLLYFFH